MGPFDHVLTSTLPRAFETAIAMGFAVTEEVEWLLPAGKAVEKERPWPQSFAAYAMAFGDGWAVAAFAREQAEHWREVVHELPEIGAALLVSHGGVIEMGAVGCLLADGVTVDFKAWGGPLHYCEGVRVHFTGNRCTGGEVLRVATGNGGAAEKA
jgi:broad specificity phosphatase PhoE